MYEGLKDREAIVAGAQANPGPLNGLAAREGHWGF